MLSSKTVTVFYSCHTMIPPWLLQAMMLVVEVVVMSVDGYKRYEKIDQEHPDDQHETHVEARVPPGRENGVSSATTLHLSP
mmetsp:Transcript_61063/g.149502  ORF Transcript_61063/g.149502 Transcript_61063/m.149502 type:complete len:81 (-) Transcript_61063:21-263(-)